MREAAYFDIKYEAYPAFISRISPVLNGRPAFIHSGFQAGPYGAKFLIFNAMDAPVVLDETSGNYLRVQGVTFTQNTSKEYTMDDLLNKVAHPSTIICPITTNIQQEADILRVHIEQGVANVRESCDIMIDQIRAIDNKRLVKKVGRLPQNLIEKVKENIIIVLDL